MLICQATGTAAQHDHCQLQAYVVILGESLITALYLSTSRKLQWLISSVSNECVLKKGKENFLPAESILAEEINFTSNSETSAFL